MMMPGRSGPETSGNSPGKWGLHKLQTLLEGVEVEKEGFEVNLGFSGRWR